MGGASQLIPDIERPDLTGRRRMRRYRPWRRQIEVRPPNRGKAITDHSPTVNVEPAVLDMASELEPLSSEGTAFFSNFPATMWAVEFPKWRRYGQFWRYLRGVMGPNFYAQRLQGVANRFRVARRRQRDLHRLKQDITDYARYCGFALVGFTVVDRRFIAEGADEMFAYDCALVLGMEMDAELLDQMPSPQDRLVDFETYIAAGRQVLEVARFIRRQGYRCLARPPLEGWVKYIPHAVNAGLAELGANGLALTPQFGPRQRWCMISIDADIEPDEPADFGLSAYCDDCQMCVHGCPGRALSEEKVWWRGVYKHKLDPVRCWPYFTRFDGCAICLKVCPVHRFGYEACMEAYEDDGTILGKPPGVERFLARRERRRTESVS